MFGSIHRHGRRMVKSVHKLLDEADAVVHFNGKKFDIPTLNKEFLLQGLTPPSPFKQVDLLQTCRRQFKFASNRLDYVSQALGEGAKLEHKGMELWRGCMAGDASAWRTMELYNRHDVKLTERLYERLLPWIEQHPNLAVFDGGERSCPRCKSERLVRRGYKVVQMQTYPQFKCLSCGTWSRGRFPARKLSSEVLRS